MQDRITLSEGSIDIMMEQRNEHLRPVVQILGTKLMPNNRIRVVIYDGQNMAQHCLFNSEEIDELYKAGKLEKYTIVRFEQYQVSSLPKKDNQPVILVTKLTVIKTGDKVGRKLDPMEVFLVENPAKSNTTASTAPSTPFSNKTSNSAIAPNSSSKNDEKKPKIEQKPVEINPENICPINVLTPFYNSWIIRARVINKSALRTYQNQKGEGKLFNFEVCDDTGEIRITAFNAECDRFYDLVEKDKTYYIGKGSVKPANKKFSTMNNDYEITLNQSSFIQPCVDAPIEAPKLRFKFTPLAKIANMPANTNIDVIGVIRFVGEPDAIVSKRTSKELIKREITIVDKSLAEARLTLWDEKAKDFDGQVGQIIALKGVGVGEFKGKTLSARDSTIINIEPDLPEAHLLRTWYQTIDSKEVSFVTLSKAGDGASSGVASNFRYIAQITPKKFISNEVLNSTIWGTIQAFSRTSNQLYKSCGFNNCQKKVVDESNGLYRCSKCDRTSPTFTWRLLMSLLVSDVTGTFWMTMFQDNVEKLYGKTAAEMAEMYETDQNSYVKFINSVRFKSFAFRLYSRLETYNNEMRVRNNISQTTVVSPTNRAAQLMRCIDIIQNQI